MSKIFFGFGLLIAISGISQDKTSKRFAKTITQDDLRRHLSILASDAYEGRETGEKGQKMAAKYISNQFKSIGLDGPVDGNYFQEFDLIKSELGDTYFRKGKEKRMCFKDFVYYSKSETAGQEYIKVIVADTEDKMIEAYDGKFVAYITERSEGLDERKKKAKAAGAIGYINFVKSDIDFKSIVVQQKSLAKRSRLVLGRRDQSTDKLIVGNSDLASWMFDRPIEEIQAGQEIQIIFNADYLDKPVPTENVLGFLKGTEKPDEVLVISAHYDHIGVKNGEVNNGADDDGSGTVAVLELAEAFVMAAEKNNGPKRSILFLTVTGEEKGLFGSRFYTDYDPVFPLENTVANLNIDMIGRIDSRHKVNSDYIYLIGSDRLSQDLHDLSEQVNQTYTNLELDYKYNDERDPNRFYYRSDHYNFAKNNIPIIFYFNGTHEDYHKPTDTVDKIEFELLEKRTRLVFHTAWEIVNREERIRVD